MTNTQSMRRCSWPRVFYRGVDTCSENAGTLPGDFTRKRCFVKACSGHLFTRVELIGRYKRKEPR